MLRRRSTESDARWTLRASVLDGSAWSIMAAVGQDNIVVLAVAAGLGDAFSGLLAVVPQLVGALLQLATPWAVLRLGSHRAWTVATAFLQALAFVPLAIAAATGHAPAALLFICAATYWAGGMACAASWHSFMSQAVPRIVRPKFFAMRIRVLNVLLIAATALNGLALEAGRRHDSLLITLAALFIIAFLSRSISAGYLAAHTEKTPIPPGFTRIGLREFIARFAHGESGRYFALLLAVQFGLQMSTPFVQPYLLRRMNLDTAFSSYGAVMAAVLLGKVVSLPMWGRLAKSGGADRLLWLGTLGLVPVPVLWLLCDNLAMALAVQFYTGAVLVAYEYAGFMRIFETVHEHERTSVMSWYQVVSTLAGVTGALLGATVLDLGVAGDHGYMWLFIAASAVRLASLPLLVRATSHAQTSLRTTLFRGLFGTSRV